MGAKIYYQEVDILKGIAILGIILLHGLINSPVDINGNLGLYGDIVRSFPLYLFFTVSGFFFYPSANSSWKDFLIKKSKRLLIPMLFFHFIIIALDGVKQIATGGGINGILLNGITSIVEGRHYWYLYSLFILLCINKLFGKHLWILALLLLPVDYYSLLQMPCKPVPLAVHFNFFFFCGVMLSKCYAQLKESIFKHKKESISVVVLLCAIICVTFLTRAFEWKLVGTFLLPLVEIPFIWITVLVINKILKKSNSQLLVHFGHYSLQYYCNHVPIMAACYLLVGKLLELSCSFVITYLILVGVTVLCSYVALLIEKRLPKLHVLFGL